jgi:molybdopterin/thiamine biosynthesis adenylyltransferase
VSERKLPEFGTDKDFQLQQALNQLKGRPVLVSKTLTERKEEKKEEAPAPGTAGCHAPPPMTDDQLLRYSRHILLDEVGIEGRSAFWRRMRWSSAPAGWVRPCAVPGIAGVGRITLVDHDTVDLTNLQRQIAHTTDAWASPRWRRPRRRHAINPEVRVTALRRSAPTPRCSTRTGAPGHVVLDCSDNYATRHAVNAACVRHGKPLVAGAVIRFDGQITVYDPRERALALLCLRVPARGGSRKCSAPPWACLRRWWAWWAPCRRPRR